MSTAIYASRPLRADLADLLARLQPGQRIRITQLVRVGLRSWPATVTGVYRHTDSLATGLATERLVRDDVVVPIVHFTKDNGEMSSIAVDENTKIEVIA
ncbi:MAG: hypothetical protein NZO58_11785 [Gemmataceae bacterium]|nr:hypothetical protein [Gemmataceae bacterium]